MAKVWLVRHGEAAATWGGGDPDPGLSEAGRAQASAAAHLLAELKPQRILTSPLKRCRETAAFTAERLGMEVAVEPHVAEIATPPDLAGEGRRDWLREAMAGEWSSIPGGDYAAWRDRVVAAVVRAEGAVVFTHFVAINAAVSAAQGSPMTTVFRPGNASITVLEVEGGTVRVVSLGSEAASTVL